MSCCGERRRSLSNPPARRVQTMARVVDSQSAPYSPPQRRLEAATAPMFVRFVGSGNVVVRGPVTNRQYSFSGRGSLQSIDSRDAIILLRDKRFDRG